MGIAEAGILQVEKLVKDILSYARAPTLQKDVFEVNSLVEEALRFVDEQIEEKRIRLTTELGSELRPLSVDGDKLRQAFLNTLLNATEAVRQGGSIVVRTRLVQEDGRDWTVVQIEDDGAGIQEKDRQSIFDPFFTTKSLGTGLGLTNARKALELHDGTIEVRSGPNAGTTITLRFPYPDEDSVGARQVEANEIHSSY